MLKLIEKVSEDIQEIKDEQPEYAKEFKIKW